MRLLGFQPVHYRWYLRASACWLSVGFVCLYCALCERLGAIGGPGAPVGGLAAHLQFEHAAAHDVVVEEVRLGVAASVELGALHIDVLSAVVEGPYGEALAVGEL